MRFLERLQPLGLAILRLVLGAIMIAHGYPKAFGGMHHFMDSVRGLHLPGWMAYLSVAAELGGGALLILGFLTRFAALAICIDMIVAIVGVHWKNGFLGQGNYQFPLSLAAIAFWLMLSGPGVISVDGARGKAR